MEIFVGDQWLELEVGNTNFYERYYTYVLFIKDALYVQNSLIEMWCTFQLHGTGDLINPKQNQLFVSVMKNILLTAII